MRFFAGTSGAVEPRRVASHQHHSGENPVVRVGDVADLQLLRRARHHLHEPLRADPAAGAGIEARLLVHLRSDEPPIELVGGVMAERRDERAPAPRRAGRRCAASSRLRRSTRKRIVPFERMSARSPSRAYSGASSSGVAGGAAACAARVAIYESREKTTTSQHRIDRIVPFRTIPLLVEIGTRLLAALLSHQSRGRRRLTA